MRILFVNTFSDPIILGGAERTLSIIVEGMRERGHEVRVVSLQSDIATEAVEWPDHTTRYPVRNLFVPDGRSARRLPEKLLWHGLDLYNPIAARDLEKEIKDFRPDVASFHNLSGWSISAWDVARHHDIPIVQVLHDYYLMCVSSMRAKQGVSCEAACGRCKLFRFLHRQRSGAVRAVVGISDHILKQFLDAGYFPGAHARRIYNVATPIGFDVAKMEFPRTLVFGFIGRIAPHKGIETLLRAFGTASLPEGSTLLIAGDGEPDYVAHLKSQYQSEAVNFLGQQNPDNFFPRLSWCVVPSVSDEPLGRVVFESHAYGVPVLGSRRGGIPEMITRGLNGYLFEAGNYSELRGLLERVSSKVDRLCRVNIRKSSEHFFDSARFLDSYEDIYSLTKSNIKMGASTLIGKL